VRKFKSLLLVAFGFVALLSSGCATTDPENMSERPWNAPKNWEHGLPTGMMGPQGR
jgi:hypothetical protein